MKCYQAKAGDIERKWWLVDADGQILGRLAVKVARILMGKTKPTYTPHLDTGDFVVVYNVGKLAVTGKKRENRVYTRYSGYPGGIASQTLGEMLEKRPAELFRLAVRRMLPKSRLGRQMLSKLKLHESLPAHGYKAQQVEPVALLAARQAS